MAEQLLVMTAVQDCDPRTWDRSDYRKTLQEELRLAAEQEGLPPAIGDLFVPVVGDAVTGSGELPIRILIHAGAATAQALELTVHIPTTNPTALYLSIWLIHFTSGVATELSGPLAARVDAVRSELAPMGITVREAIQRGHEVVEALLSRALGSRNIENGFGEALDRKFPPLTNDPDEDCGEGDSG